MVELKSKVRAFGTAYFASLLGLACLALPAQATIPVMLTGHLMSMAGSSALERRHVLEVRYRRSANRDADDAEALFDEGQYEFDSQDYRSAQRIFERLIDEHPNSGHALKAQRYLANIYRRNNAQRPRPARITTTTLQRSLPPTAPKQSSLRPEPRRQISRAPIRPSLVQPDPAMQRQLLLNVGDRVFFAADSERIGAKARDVLQRQAAWLKQNKGLRIRIEGHSHDNGGQDSDLELSLRRAEEVRLRLIEEGVAAERISVFGRGRADPVAICDTALCAAQNRRVMTRVYRPDDGTSVHRRASLPQPQR